MNNSKSNGFSIASLACGIASIVFSGAMGIQFAIVSLIMRAVYRKRNNGVDNSDTETGFITSIIGIVVSVVEFITAVIIIALFASTLIVGLTKGILE